MVRKSRPLGCVLAIVVLGACLVPAMFGAKLFLGTHPGAIPGSRTQEKELLPVLKDAVGPLPAAFSAEAKLMVNSGVSFSARGTGTVEDGVVTHRMLIDAISQSNPGSVQVRPSTTIDTGDAKVEITGVDTARLDAMAGLAGELAGPAKQVKVSLDQPRLFVRAGYRLVETADANGGEAGPCEAARSEFVAQLPEIAELQRQGVPVEAEFMQCSDNAPGAEFPGFAPAEQVKDVDQLLRGSLGNTVYWAKLRDDGKVYVRFRDGQESAEANWRAQWRHGEVSVFRG